MLELFCVEDTELFPEGCPYSMTGTLVTLGVAVGGGLGMGGTP